MGLVGRIFPTGRGRVYQMEFELKEQYFMLISKRAVAVLACAVFIFGLSAGAFAVEMTLAGIKLGSQANAVLKKYGNPTRVTVGTVSAPTAGGGQATAGAIGMPGPMANPAVG